MKLSIGIVFVLLFLNPTVSNAQIVIQPLTTNSPVLVSVRVGDGTLCTIPTITFTNQTNLGFAREGANSIVLCIGGSSQFDWSGTSYKLAGDSVLSWTTTAANSTAATDITLRRSAAKTLVIDTDGAGGALTLVDIFSPLQVEGIFAPQSAINASASVTIGWNGRSILASTANKLLQINDSGNTTGTEFNNGTPTLGTCTGGSLVSGSHNGMGEITGNTSGSCILNFGTPNFTNTPFCILNDETNLVAARVSARSASSITITGLTSGDAVQYICVGRIGT